MGTIEREELRKLVIAFVLGDGSLSLREGRKEAYFQISHCKEQYNYLIWKQKILDNITSSTINHTKKKLNGRTFHGYHLGTKQHPFFTKLYRRMYHNRNKVLDEYIAKKIDDRSLAIIFMDDGTVAQRDTSGELTYFLCTQKFDYANHLLLKKSLKLNLGLEWNINKANKKKDGTYNYRLRLPNRFNEQFVKIIKPYVFSQFYYKLYPNASQDNSCDIVRTS